MRASDIIIGLFVFSAVVFGMGDFYTKTSANYNYTAPALEGYNQTAGLSSMTSDMGAALSSGQVNVVDQAFIILSTAWNALTMPLRAVNMVAATLFHFNGPASEGGTNGLLPGWLSDLLLALLTFVIVISIIAAATRSNP